LPNDEVSIPCSTQRNRLTFNSHNRDGQGKHRITAGKVNYWPNRFESLPPVPPHKGGFESYPEKVQGIAQRLKSKKFGEHINQAQLFYNSLTPPEKMHLEQALAFELDHCDEEIVYTRLCDRLRVSLTMFVIRLHNTANMIMHAGH
jgi:catalase